MINFKDYSEKFRLLLQVCDNDNIFIKYIILSLFESLLDVIFVLSLVALTGQLVGSKLNFFFNINQNVLIYVPIFIFILRSYVTYFNSVWLIKKYSQSLRLFQDEIFFKIIRLNRLQTNDFDETETNTFLNQEIPAFFKNFPGYLDLIRSLITLGSLLVFLVFNNIYNFYYVIIISLISFLYLLFYKKNFFHKISNEILKYMRNKLKYGSILVRFSEDIKNFFAQEFFIDKFSKVTSEEQDLMIFRHKVTNAIKFVLEITLVTLLFVYLIVLLNIYGFNEAIVQFTAIFAVGLRLIQPLKTAISKIAGFQFDDAFFKSCKKKLAYFDKIDFKNIQDTNKKIEKIEIDFNNIKLNTIDFKINKKQIISNLNFEVNKGAKIGIYGASGSGKSTLINIICGKYFADGDYILDGKKLTTDEIINFSRNNISLISQSSLLLNAALKNNIAFGIEEDKIDEKNVLNVIKKAGLNTFFNKIDRDLNFEIDGINFNVSEGEKRRILIARSLYFFKPIMILDEATVNLDYQTQKDIIDNILNDKKTTVIIISHNLEIIQKCEKIYEMNNQKLSIIKE